ncbi:MAG: TnsA endonuclease N-terminal domain-containing protein [Flavobacteriales bacterium]|nr:TnsA endonuclease N-terminal domain-containing protein [Flavobacteriales bacterium]
MQAHFHIGEHEIKVKSVAAFMPIIDHNYSRLLKNGYRDYRENVTPISSIPKYIFRGFEKALHLEYKFDSKTEKDFAVVLENDQSVIKWLRPADKQFHIYYNQHSSLYRPDFVVETQDGIYMVETKASNEINSPEVQDKAKFARRYCQQATEYTATIGGKPWAYLLIPHDEVMVTRSWGWYLSFK